MVDPTKASSDQEKKLDQAQLLIDVMRENTLALIECAKANRALASQIAPSMGSKHRPPGLMDMLRDLEEAVYILDDRLTALAIKLSMVEYVLDRVADIAFPDPGTKSDVSPREPTWRDVALAKREYDKRLEEEAIRAMEEEEKKNPPKKVMLSNSP